MRLIIDNKFTILHKKIVNIIEHPGYGTLHYEILPLLNYDDQEVILTDSLNAIFFNHFDYYVIHTTGHMYYIVSNLEYLLKNNVNVSLFFMSLQIIINWKRKKLF